MSEVKTMPDCWVVVDGGQIIGTNDAPGHVNGIDAVRYVPATEVEATKNSAAIWHRRYTEVCQDRIALRQKCGHEIEALEQEVEALKADAERYRWLRDQHWVEPEARFRLGLSNESEDDAALYEQELNKAIDAALKKAQE